MTSYAPGVVNVGTVVGTERVKIDTGGAVLTVTSTDAIANLVRSSGTLTTPIINGGTVTGTFVNGGTVSGGSWSGATVNTSTLAAPTISGLLADSITNAITASTTQTLAGGVKITTDVSVVSSAHTGDAVTLPVNAPGQRVTIFNNAGSAIAVFPGEVGSTIDGGTTAAAVTLTNAKNATFYNNAANTWISAQGGAKSA